VFLLGQENSVLSSDKWYKVSVTNTGVHKLSYKDFQNLNIELNDININSIKLFGNGGGMLPNLNSQFRYNDLQENAIYVYDFNNNGYFNSNDYILFYAESPNKWSYSESIDLFEYKEHLFSDECYYFITIDTDSNGKRILNKPLLTDYTKVIKSFNDFKVHESNIENLIQSGREWYGERFGIIDNYVFDFSFPNLINSEPIYIKTSVAARSLNSSSFTVNANSNFISNINIPNIVYDYATEYAKKASNTQTYISSSDQISIELEFNYSENNAIGWLDYLQLNARRSLAMHNNILNFRDFESLDSLAIGKFEISNANSSTIVWDVTDILNIKKVNANLNGSVLSFIDSLDILREYCAFENSFLTPNLIGMIENQNLHNISLDVNYVIISHPIFLTQANRLSDIHEYYDNLTSVVVTPQQIYNEFSSGMQDVAAIRDFLKMLYDRQNSNLEYALLFGDGSYDNKDRIINNTNFIPTFQSTNSLSPVNSFVTDDFFALLDDDDGDLINDLIDIGIGRFPAKNLNEAINLVDKVETYYSAESLGDWRNSITFIADDGDAKDGNLHMSDADKLANFLDTNNLNVNINKIYLDNYLQESTPGGPRSPDAQEAINRSIDNGTFLVNYSGHGGPLGWTQERILEIDQINNWTNKYKLPLFMTATCKFSCFDNPGKTSAGELVLLNPEGGAIALLTTTRLVYAFPNYKLNENFMNIFCEKNNGEFPTLGQLFKKTKVLSGSNTNSRNFTLLGDPALRLSYPKYIVSTTNISDTLKALEEVEISGKVTDDDGNLLVDFNGILYPTIYDKEIISLTLGQESCSPMPFRNQNNIIYKGEASVSNGEFSFSFIVPKDIENNYAHGKVSYYASNDNKEDASGHDDSFIIGGLADNVIYDYDGPLVSLYMNTRDFIFGGMTNSDPFLLVDIEDFSGINTVGNGIGHDITAILDNNTSNPFILNDYYKSNLDDYKSGVIEFPFENLEPGPHTITLKIWDVFNNSSESVISFYVTDKENFTISDFLNYPNPFITNTDFYFEHNQSNQNLDVSIEIYSITGQHIKTLKDTFYDSGYRIGPISWNGKNEYGKIVSSGLYIAKLNIELDNGFYETKSIRIAITP
jgi:hypothetical protein|tara:strand:+ start:969 stop:4280 length:3312 start_codon:yes stop_codon:yes gene_type:complete